MRATKKRVSTADPKLMTVNALSMETGLDRKTIDKRIRASGLNPAQVRGKKKLYDYSAVLDVIAPKQSASSSLKDQKLFEEVRKLRAVNDEKDGIVVKRADVASSITAWSAKVDAIIEQKLCNEYPTAVAGLEPEQARVFGKRLGDSIRRLLAESFDVWIC